MPVVRVVQSVIEVQADAAPRAPNDLRVVLDAGGCVLVAADVFPARGEPRPHRPGLEPACAADMVTPPVAGRGGCVSFPLGLPA
jgi:hypothetical protein